MCLLSHVHLFMFLSALLSLPSLKSTPGRSLSSLSHVPCVQNPCMQAKPRAMTDRSFQEINRVYTRKQ
jgi:hypothetical protein